MTGTIGFHIRKMTELKRDIIISAFTALCTAGFSGCILEDIKPCPPVDIRVEPDWALAPGADPEGMAYCFYPVDGGDPWRFDLAGREGGTVRIPEGVYSLIVFNDDTSGVLFRDLDSYEKAEVYSRELSFKLAVNRPDAPNVSGCLDPDIMWTSACPRIEVKEGEIVRCSPKQLTPRIKVDIYDIKNLSGADSYFASLDGLGEAVCLCNSRIDSTTSVPFALRPSADDSLTGSFHCFGVVGMGHTLSLYVTMADGEKLHFRYDVGEQMQNSADSMLINILVPGPELPESGSSDKDAFDVEVDGWHTVNVYF